jgi:cytochrome P450
MESLRDELGDVFLLPAPGFRVVVLSGPAAARFTYVEARASLRWRAAGDPVTSLLRHGLLVEDGESHAALRRSIMPHLHRRVIESRLETFIRRADQVCASWDLRQPLDMLVEMRRIALLILVDALFDADLTPDVDRLWQPILRAIRFISPGIWLLWRGAPQIGLRPALRELDAYLYSLIAAQREGLRSAKGLIPSLLRAGLSDDLVRDQLLTLLIAGHDTSTAHLAWTLYLLAAHPASQQLAQAEVDAVCGGCPPSSAALGQLTYLEQVIDESLRLYPPIHVSNRSVAEDLEFGGCRVPAGERLMFSIYLTHRDGRCWPDPDRYDPARFAPSVRREPYAFVPFGGGPRNCIGAAFAQAEAKAVLARLLQRYRFTLLEPKVRLHMGATLEPGPGVLVRVEARR